MRLWKYALGGLAMKEQPKLKVSDVGVISVDSNELARSKAGRKQIDALSRLTKK